MKNASLLIHTDELSYAWIDRMVKHGIPTLAIHPTGGNTAHESLADLLKKFDDPDYRKMLDYAADCGLKIEYEMHAARFLLPASEFEKHPELFRMNSDGERVPDYNLCASNQEALDYIAENAAKLVKKLYRSTNRYFLWLDDSRHSECHCPECSKLSPSDQQLKILNHIIKRLRKDNSDATLAYLAYFKCIKCPTEIKPENGIFLEYAPFERDFNSPLQNDMQSEPLQELLSYFGSDDAKALDYWYDNSMFSGWKKPPKAFKVNKDVLFADFEYYNKLGFDDIGCFACFLGEDYEQVHGDVDIEPFATAFSKI